jgi:XRE family transcriptional regulator, master regulator for biofilm formation
MDGNLLQKIRQEKGYSLNRLSKLTGISKSYLSLLERHIQKNPSIDIIEKIAKALDVGIHDLIAAPKKKTKMLKVEINFAEDELSKEKISQIKDLLDLIGE